MWKCRHRRVLVSPEPIVVCMACRARRDWSGQCQDTAQKGGTHSPEWADTELLLLPPLVVIAVSCGCSRSVVSGPGWWSSVLVVVDVIAINVVVVVVGHRRRLLWL
jgi:hypothetical protein